MPLERNAHRTFADDNYVYLLGGYNPTATPSSTLSDVWRFNRLTQAWQQCTLADPSTPLPVILGSFSFVCRGPGPDFNCGSNEAYFYGGRKEPPPDEFNSNKLYWIKIDKAGRVHLKLQTVLGDEQLPAQYGQGMCRRLEMRQDRRQEVIYIVGGSNYDVYNMDVWKLQRPAGAKLDDPWNLTRLNRQIPDVLGRSFLEVVHHREQLVTFGGISDRYVFRLNDHTIFDLKSNEFEQVKTQPDPVHGFPQNRYWPMVVHRGNMVYLLGGRAQELIALDTVWRFDLDKRQWTKLPTSLAVPVFWNSAALTPDGCIFVFGGSTNDQPRHFCRVNCLQRMWLLPPSLVQLAAGKVLEGMSAGQLNKLTEEGVRLADVPLFVSRIMGPDQEEEKIKDEKNSPDQDEKIKDEKNSPDQDEKIKDEKNSPDQDEKNKKSPPPAAQHQQSTSSGE